MSAVYLQSTQAVKWRIFLETLLPLGEGNLYFGPKGLEISSLSLTFGIHAKLCDFDEYRYNAPGFLKIPIGLDFRLFYQCYQNVKEMDVIVFEIERPESDRVICEVISEGVRTRCELTTLFRDHSIAEDNIAEHQFDCVLDLNSAKLQTQIRFHDKHGQMTQILADCQDENGCRVFLRTDGDFSSITSCLDAIKSPGELKHQSSDKQDVYSNRTLNQILKAASLSPFVRVCLVDNYPLVLTWEVGAMGTIQFLVPAQAEIEKGQQKITLAQIDAKAYQLYHADPPSSTSGGSTSGGSSSVPVKKIKRKRQTASSSCNKTSSSSSRKRNCLRTESSSTSEPQEVAKPT